MRHPDSRTKSRLSVIARDGLSMLEVIVSLIMVTTILLVSLQSAASVMRNRTIAKQGITSQRLAGYFLDEISVLDFVDPDGSRVIGLDTGESSNDRSSYDDVDDYHGLSVTSPSFRDGSAMPGFENWTVTVSVVPADTSGRNVVTSTETEWPIRLVTVSVASPSGIPQSFRTLVSNVPSSQSKTVSHQRLRKVKVSFSAQRSMDLLIPLRNTPPQY